MIHSSGVTPSFAQVGDRLRRYAIVFTAIDHRFFGNLDAYNMARAPSEMVCIARLAIPFCSCIYGTDVYKVIPFSLIKHCMSELMNSVPLSAMKLQTFAP